MRWRRRRAVVVLAALAALVSTSAGCTEGPAVTRSGAAPQTPDPAISRAPDSRDLAGAKKEAGIEDCPVSDPAVPALESGLPDAVLPCLGGGRPVRLAGLRGQPMLINVWAQWCTPCRQEAPYLAEVATTNTTPLLVLGIDHADNQPGLAIEFARFASWTYPQLQDRNLVLRSELQVVALPQTLFVRADGTIAHRNFRPFESADQIRELSQRYLGVMP